MEALVRERRERASTEEEKFHAHFYEPPVFHGRQVTRMFISVQSHPSKGIATQGLFTLS
jgi:hypothetical protein